eukprot:GHVR01190081.1.p3 GENE.GHVR01190081.1~~GHVR01190081.1.p3  ORF type:complete len:101 (+),score=6.14 GHVR01190081.1:85-387(+)
MMQENIIINDLQGLTRLDGYFFGGIFPLLLRNNNITIGLGEHTYWEGNEADKANGVRELKFHAARSGLDICSLSGLNEFVWPRLSEAMCGRWIEAQVPLP